MCREIGGRTSARPTTDHFRFSVAVVNSKGFNIGDFTGVILCEVFGRAAVADSARRRGKVAADSDGRNG
jgi:hypothetical protein